MVFVRLRIYSQSLKYPTAGEEEARCGRWGAALPPTAAGAGSEEMEDRCGMRESEWGESEIQYDAWVSLVIVNIEDVI